MELLNVSLWLAAAVLLTALISLVFGLVRAAVMMVKQQEF